MKSNNKTGNVEEGRADSESGDIEEEYLIEQVHTAFQLPFFCREFLLWCMLLSELSTHNCTSVLKKSKHYIHVMYSKAHDVKLLSNISQENHRENSSALKLAFKEWLSIVLLCFVLVGQWSHVTI